MINKYKLKTILESKSSRGKVDFLLFHSQKYKMLFNGSLLVNYLNEIEYKTYYKEMISFLDHQQKIELCNHYISRYELIKK